MSNLLQKKKRMASALLAILLVLLSIFTVSAAEISSAAAVTEETREADPEDAATLELHMLDVGQALCILVKVEKEGEEPHYLLYDGGGRDTSSYVVAYLKKQGLSDLEYIVVSHYDEDHIGGIVGALNVFDCETVLSPDYEADSKIYQSFVSAVQKDDAEVIHPGLGNQFPLGDAVITVVGPEDYTAETENNRSLAIRIQLGNNSFLICGDAQEEEEESIVNSGLEIESDVYIVNHHGSGGSSGFYFLNHVHPTYALLSCSDDNSYGHPHLEAMERLQAEGVELFRTDKQGEIIAYSDGENITFNQEPCNDFSAGTVQETSSGANGSGQLSDSASGNTAASGSSSSAESANYTYVCNIKSYKFHRAYCDSVDKMSEANKLYTNDSRESLIAQGYSPCQSCNP